MTGLLYIYLIKYRKGEDEMKKQISTMILVSTLAISLVACGGNKGTSYHIPEVKVVTIADLQAQGTTKIDFWHSFTTAAVEDALTEAIAKFEEEYPFIEVTATSKGGYDNLKSAVTLEIPTSNTPDVVIGYPDHFAEYLAGEIMIPLDAYMNSKEDGIGIDVTDIYTDYLKENQQFVGNNTFGIPFNKSTEVLSYNKTFFDAHNLTVPKTWAEVRVVCQEAYDIIAAVMATESKIDPATGIDYSGDDFSLNNFYPMSWDASANQFITIVQSWGGEFTEMGETFETGKIKFQDNAATKEALTFFKDMYTDHLFAPPAQWEQQYANNAGFLNFVMSVGSSAGAQYYGNTIYEVGVAGVPYKDANHAYAIQQGTNLAILANNTDYERLASWLFVRYLTSADVNASFAMDAGYYPVRKAGTASTEYQKFINADLATVTTAQKQTILAAKANINYLEGDVKYTMFSSPAFIGSSEVRTVVGNIIPAITVAGQSIDAALADAVSQLPNYK